MCAIDNVARIVRPSFFSTQLIWIGDAVAADLWPVSASSLPSAPTLATGERLQEYRDLTTGDQDVPAFNLGG